MAAIPTALSDTLVWNVLCIKKCTLSYVIERWASGTYDSLCLTHLLPAIAQ